jgi:hypothetical protein
MALFEGQICSEIQEICVNGIPGGRGVAGSNPVSPTEAAAPRCRLQIQADVDKTT